MVDERGIVLGTSSAAYFCGRNWKLGTLWRVKLGSFNNADGSENVTNVTVKIKSCFSQTLRLFQLALNAKCR